MAQTDKGCDQMVIKYDLGDSVMWAGRRVTIVSRCFAGGQWLYGIRLPRGKVINYVPHRLLSVAE